MNTKFGIPLVLLLCLPATVQGQVRLTDVEFATKDAQFAIEATKANLRDRGYDPSEFYVEISDDRNEVTLSLSHQDSYINYPPPPWKLNWKRPRVHIQ